MILKDKNMRRVTTICLIGVVAFYVYHCFYWYGHVIDDAFITFRYANNFIKDLGLVYNPGERVEGYSNFFFLMLLSLGMKLGIGAIHVARSIGVISGTGSIYCSYWLYNRLSGTQGTFIALTGPVLLATNSFFCFWSFAGLETTLFSFLLILAIALYIREDHKAHPFSAYIFGLLCLTRPEGVAYVTAFFTVDTALRTWRKDCSVRYCVLFCAIFLAIVSGHLIFRRLYYGGWYPNTYYAKVSMPFIKSGNFKYINNFFLCHGKGILLFMLLASLAMFVRDKSRNIWGVVSALLINWFIILYVQLDWMPNYRYHMHTLPLMLACISLGIGKLIGQFNKADRRYGKAAGIIILFLIAFYVRDNISIDQEKQYWAISTPSSHKTERWLISVPENVRKGISPVLVDETFFLIENTDENMTVGLRDIGFPGYISNCRIYDKAWLVNKEAPVFKKKLNKRDWKAFQTYVSTENYKYLEGYDPDFFLYPSELWKLMDTMYSQYFKEHMELIKTTEYGMEKIAYYRKKGLTRQLSVDEIIRKYAKIIQEHPEYPAFQYRYWYFLKNAKKENTDGFIGGKLE